MPSFENDHVQPADSEGPSWSEWSAPEMAALRPHIDRVASVVLKDRQLVIFMRHMAGESLPTIGDAVGIAHPSVHECLHGRAGKGGILRKLHAALREDDAFNAVVVEVHKVRAKAETAAKTLGWFATILVPPHPELFVAFAVLFWMDRLADANRMMRLQDVAAVMPKQVVTHAMPLLRYGGWIESNGITVRILKTPVDGKER